MPHTFCRLGFTSLLTGFVLNVLTVSLWAQMPDSKQYYSIESVSQPGQVLDVFGARSQPGTNVTLYRKIGQDNQLWRFVPSGDGFYFIETKLGTGLVLDIDNWGKNDQTNIHIVRKGSGTSAQKFRCVPLGNSIFRFESAMGNQIQLGVANDRRNVVSRVGNQGNRVIFKLLPSGKQSSNRPNPNVAVKPIRVMTYNTFLIPTSLVTDISNAYKGNLNLSSLQRAAAIADADFLKGHDLLILNELFLNDAAQSIFNGLESTYPHRTPVIGRSTDGWHSTSGRSFRSLPLNGGVAILSKWPIEEKSQHIFQSACEEDSLAAKGFAYVKINRNGEKIHLIGTHLQAVATVGTPPNCSKGTKGVTKEGWKVRENQCREIRRFIDNKNIPSNEMVLIGGDLNVVQAMPEYNTMLNILSASHPILTGHPVTYDPMNSIIATPDNYGELLDYILVDNKHRSPGKWHNHVLTPKISIAGKGSFDLSDHYPVLATVNPIGSPAKKQKCYVVKIRTGTSSGAGTDSNISLSITGSNGQTRKIRLNGYLSGNAFENGDQDVLDLCVNDVGTISSITVSSDNSYPASDWQLSSISIFDESKEYYFPCNNWLTGKAPQRTLLPGPPPKNYDIVVKTGTRSGAGTDSNIYLTIHGDKGKTREVRLNGYISGNAFENGRTDMVYLKNLKDVGTPRRVTVRSDNKYAGSGWFLDYISINGRRARFSRWIESGKLSATANVSN